jgi:NhaA family Na+:H+ antiporter
MTDQLNKQPVDTWIIDPMKRFMSNSTTSGIILFSSALLALILANSPWANDFHHIWEIKFSVGFGKYEISKSLHHWINDGLMAVFFFVVGLELKREIISGELSNPKKAVLPMVAAVGGMVFPALIYLLFNRSGSNVNGWGIPMATDIAFALGVLYLLGNKVPLSVKIFLTALAIADDLGAVLVIAFFYTSDINFMSLAVGALFLIILITGNIIGVRNTMFYAIIGIGGLWMAFLMSGVHATIAAVLAAFTIPANVKISDITFMAKGEILLSKFHKSKPNDKPTLTSDQFHIFDEMQVLLKKASTPLQRLEHRLHPLVAFIIMPVFALCNAGVTISGDFYTLMSSSITLGVFSGLFLGKVIGIVGAVFLLLKFNIAKLPDDVNNLHVIGIGFLGAIGFTMSLFVSELAFTDPLLINQAKIGVISASLLASFVGFYVMKLASKKNQHRDGKS